MEKFLNGEISKFLQEGRRRLTDRSGNPKGVGKPVGGVAHGKKSLFV